MSRFMSPNAGATGGNDDAQEAPANDVAEVADQDSDGPDAVTGIDPLQSRLWAQVHKGEPAMVIDDDGRLRHCDQLQGYRRAMSPPLAISTSYLVL